MMRNRSNENRGRWRSGDGGSRDISQFKKPEKHEDKGAREEGRWVREGGERWIGEDREGGEQGIESRPCTQQTQMEMLCGRRRKI